MTDDFTPPSLDEALARLDMPLAEAMTTQRAVRRLHTVPVDLQLIEHLLGLALKAPTSSNSQDWTFIVITDPDQKRELGQLYGQFYDRFQPIERWLARKDEKRLRQMKPGQWQREHFDEIPVFVIPCYRRNLKHRPVGRPQVSVSSYYGSVFPAVQNLLLSCRAVGLGASLQTLPIWRIPPARRILGLPREMNPVCVIPIGWAKGKYGPTTRPTPQEVIHYDRFGNQPDR